MKKFFQVIFDKTNKNIFFAYIKQCFVNSINKPLFFILAIFYNISCALYYFFLTGFFSGNGSTNLRMFFLAIPYISIILIPLLCFRQDEKYTQTLPLSNIEKVFANIIIPFLQFFIITLPLLIIPICVNFFGYVDIGQVTVGFVLLLFYAISVISVSAFFYTIFSALVALIFSAIFISLTDFASLNKLLQFISFAYRFDAASKGIFDFRDIIFFVCISLLFMLLSFIATEKNIGKKFTKTEKSYYFIIIAIIFLTFLNSTKYYFRVDFTKDKTFSISDYTKQVAENIDSNIKITYYRSSSILNIYPQVRDIYELLKTFSIENKNISIEIKNPDTQSLTNLLESYGITSQQIMTGSANRSEYLSVYSSIVLEYKNKVQIIPFVVSVDKLEYDLTRCIKQLTDNMKKRILFICGNGMTIQEDYSYAFEWLRVQGFECIEISPSELENFSSDDILLIFGTSNINTSEAEKIESFILQGGATLFATSKYTPNIKEDWKILYNTNNAILEMILSWGISFENALIIDRANISLTLSSEDNQNNLQGKSIKTEQINYPFWISIPPQENIKNGMTLFWSSPIKINNKNILSFVETSSSSKKLSESEDANNLFDTNPFSNITGNNAIAEKQTVCAFIDGNVQGYFTPQNSEKTKVCVISDQYFVNNLAIEYANSKTNTTFNFDFLTYTVLKLAGENDLATLQNKIMQNASFYKTPDFTSFSKAVNKTCIIIFCGIPIFYIAFAIIIFIFRKKYINSFMKKIK